MAHHTVATKAKVKVVYFWGVEMKAWTDLKYILQQACILVVFWTLSGCATPETSLLIRPTKLPAFGESVTKNILPTADELKVAWLQPQDCTLPCWNGIQVGVSSRSEALAVLDESGLQPFESLRSLLIRRYPYRARDNHPTWTNITIESDIVVTSIQMDFPVARLDESIGLLGEPTHVIAVQDFPPDAPTSLSSSYWYIDVIWLEKGVALSRSGVGTAPNISASFKVDHLQFFVPTTAGYSDVTSPRNMELFVPWQGYAEFDRYDSTERIYYSDN